MPGLETPFDRGVGDGARARVAAGRLPPGRLTGIALESADPRADHAALQGKGVDVDADMMGGDGTVPLLFFFRDHDGDQLMIVEGR